MTTATMALDELAEKGADIDMLRQMAQFMAQRLMELDVEAHCGTGYDEKSAQRLKSRNGYRERTWDTRAGTVPLNAPSCAKAATPTIHFDYDRAPMTFVEVVHPDHNNWYTPYTLSNIITKYTNWALQGMWFFNGISLLAIAQKSH